MLRKRSIFVFVRTLSDFLTAYRLSGCGPMLADSDIPQSNARVHVIARSFGQSLGHSLAESLVQLKMLSAAPFSGVDAS